MKVSPYLQYITRSRYFDKSCPDSSEKSCLEHDKAKGRDRNNSIPFYRLDGSALSTSIGIR